MTTSKLDAIEQRQIRMENDIKAINEMLSLFITRGAEQADARFPGNQPEFIGFTAGFIASPARA